MTFDLAKIIIGKREFRRQLAARPIEEKLAMLDALRERALAIRPQRSHAEVSRVITRTTEDYARTMKRLA
jgi:hypothetical protein